MAHPGFNAVARRIMQKEHVTMDRAKAMLAAGTRRAGFKARRANPRLNKVRG